MDISKVVVIALISIIIIAVLKQHRPEFATYISLFACILILYVILKELTPIIKMLQNMSEKLGVNKKFFMILLKITGIAYLSEFTSNICKDSGETAIASKVELAGKVLIISISIPIITTLIETIVKLI